MSPLDRAEIATRLPHGESAVELDTLEQISETLCTATRTWNTDHPALDGHFPGNPVVPGHVILEAMAQCAGLCGTATTEGPALAFLAAARSVKWTLPVLPGEQVNIQAELIKKLGASRMVDVIVTKNPKLRVATAELTITEPSGS